VTADFFFFLSFLPLAAVSAESIRSSKFLRGWYDWTMLLVSVFKLAHYLMIGNPLLIYDMIASHMQAMER
jgi:hypothetical protein